VKDLVESDEVSDLSALMFDDLKNVNNRNDETKLLCAEVDLLMPDTRWNALSTLTYGLETRARARTLLDTRCTGSTFAQDLQV
jgi:hypothetical protein